MIQKDCADPVTMHVCGKHAGNHALTDQPRERLLVTDHTQILQNLQATTHSACVPLLPVHLCNRDTCSCFEDLARSVSAAVWSTYQCKIPVDSTACNPTLCQNLAYSRCNTVCSAPPTYRSTGIQYFSASASRMH